jgi:endonuclease/exonuclease/phosphatase family metal-dependent hydrolase
MLIRSWNLFHGNTWPPQRRSFLEEMVRLASQDRPDVLLLQEVPVWALGRLGTWSGMTAIGDAARRSTIAGVPIPAGLGRQLTSLHPGLLRSAFSGQGNAILLGGSLQPAEHRVLALNPRAFRREAAKRLRLPLLTRLIWARERRICSVVRAAPQLLVANLHATSLPPDPRIPAAEVRRALRFVQELARLDDVVVLGGDFNLQGTNAAQKGWSPPGPGIDHVLVRSVRPSPLRVWPDQRRLIEGMLVSDHAPVELDL